MTQARTLVLYIVGAFAASVALAIVAAIVVFRQYQAKQEERLFDHAAQTRHVQELVEDLDLIATFPPLAAAMREESNTDKDADAGGWLNRQLPWRPIEGSTAAAALVIPGQLQALLDQWGRDWLDQAVGLPLDGLDFRWMGEAHKYRYWSLEGEGPLAEALAGNPRLEPMEEPVPDMAVLSDWVKLRIASVLQGAPAEPAWADVAQLAHLAMTGQRLVTTMIGVDWLRQLERAATKLEASGRPLPAGMRYDADLLRRTRRALWGEMAYVDLTVPADLSERVFPEAGPRRPGACAAVNERLPALQLERALLGPFYPDDFARVEKVAERLMSGCRPAYVHALFRDKSRLPSALEGNIFDLVDIAAFDERLGRMTQRSGSQWRQLESLPFLRKTIGLILADLAKPRMLAAYEEGFEPE